MVITSAIFPDGHAKDLECQNKPAASMQWALHSEDRVED